MIYEIALLPVECQHVEAFERAFGEVASLLARAEGHLGHVLARGVETPERFNLIVRWRSLEDHSPRFEGSEDHRQFMHALEPFFSGEPTVYHVAPVMSVDRPSAW